MAEFCNPSCGLRGNCSGEVSEANVAQVTVARHLKDSLLRMAFRKDYHRKFENWGTYTVVTGENGGTSEVISTGSLTSEEVIAAIGNCAGRGKGLLCGAFPQARYPYQETPAARLMSERQVQEQLAIIED